MRLPLNIFHTFDLKTESFSRDIERNKNTFYIIKLIITSRPLHKLQFEKQKLFSL